MKIEIAAADKADRRPAVTKVARAIGLKLCRLGHPAWSDPVDALLANYKQAIDSRLLNATLAVSQSAGNTNTTILKIAKALGMPPSKLKNRIQNGYYSHDVTVQVKQLCGTSLAVAKRATTAAKRELFAKGTTPCCRRCHAPRLEHLNGTGFVGGFCPDCAAEHQRACQLDDTYTAERRQRQTEARRAS